jgi:hypothetical protein
MSYREINKKKEKNSHKRNNRMNGILQIHVCGREGRREGGERREG